MPTGVVIGFTMGNGDLNIRPDDGSADLFAVKKDITGSPFIWDRVEFEPTVDQSTGRPRARRVRIEPKGERNR